MDKQEKEKTEAREQETEKETQELPSLIVVPSQTEAEQISDLKSQISNLQKEAGANYDKFLRVCADLENYKKRAEKERAELISFANEKLVKELLPVLDNLERAIEHIEDESNLSAIKDGVKLVLDNLISVLKKFGVAVVSALGDKFDPTKHEAVSQEETSKHEAGTVVKEYHKCYYLNNRLIRPAMVVIAKTPEASQEKEELAGEKD